MPSSIPSASSTTRSEGGVRYTAAHRAALIAIVAAGLALRLAYFAHAVHTPGYTWEDPDKYIAQAMRLAGPDGWRWTYRAVTYTINGQRHALPPMYSVFLSLFVLFPGFPLTAQIAQIFLSAAAIWLVFALGRLAHTPRAGLLAATAYALWVPNIFNVWSTSQETLYIPLILAALLLLGRAVERNARPLAFGIAGTLFGLAALTRSMPLFFVWPAALAHVLVPGTRRRAVLQASAFLAGFLLLTVPYSVGLSRYFGQTTIIDTHGSIHVDAASTGGRAPGLLDTALALSGKLAADPAGYLTETLNRARSLFHVNGGRILQIYVIAPSKTAAVAWKGAVHAGADGLLVAAVVLAPLGAAACTNGRLAVLCVLWTIINVAIASLGGFSGARLRAPFEPLLLVFAGAALAGAWHRRHAVVLAVATAGSIVAAAAVLPQVPASLRAWPDYGVRWPSIFDRHTGTITGDAGLNVPAFEGIAELTATAGTDSAADLQVRAGGVHVRTVRLEPRQPTTIRTFWPARGLAYIELSGTGLPGMVISVP